MNMPKVTNEVGTVAAMVLSIGAEEPYVIIDCSKERVDGIYGLHGDGKVVVGDMADGSGNGISIYEYIQLCSSGEAWRLFSAVPKLNVYNSRRAGLQR